MGSEHTATSYSRVSLSKVESRQPKRPVSGHLRFRDVTGSFRWSPPVTASERKPSKRDWCPRLNSLKENRGKVPFPDQRPALLSRTGEPIAADSREEVDESESQARSRSCVPVTLRSAGRGPPLLAGGFGFSFDR
jgi:hypothetical protein